MNQIPRLTLLETMGIKAWFARYKLPNAADSSYLNDASLLNNEAANENKFKLHPAERPIQVEHLNHKIAPVISIEPESKVAEVTEANNIKDELRVEQSDVVVRFELNVYFSEQYIIVDSMPKEFKAGEQEYSAKLAANILRFFGQKSFQQASISWPIHDNPASIKDAVSAREYVKSFIKFQAKAGIKCIILCGKDAADYSFQLKDSKPGQSSIGSLDANHQIKLLVNYSLSQLLSSSNMKAEFWNHCVPLLSD